MVTIRKLANMMQRAVNGGPWSLLNKVSHVPMCASAFFFYLDFLSRTFTIHRTAGEAGAYLFNS